MVLEVAKCFYFDILTMCEHAIESSCLVRCELQTCVVSVQTGLFLSRLNTKNRTSLHDWIADSVT